MKEKKLLWISPLAPYDGVGHAGGKNHNYFIKYVKSHTDYDITLISLRYQSEKMDLKQYGINDRVIVIDRNPIQSVWRKFVNIESLYNPFNKRCGLIMNYQHHALEKEIREYYEAGNQPEVIICQWTAAAMQIGVLKKLFPQSKLIMIEEDVTFLMYKREWEQASGALQVFLKNYRYQRMKKLELSYINQFDVVAVNNPKDRRLLLDEDVSEEKIQNLTPYFDLYYDVKRTVKEPYAVLFYGAMSRKENYLAARWFAEQVMPLLEGENIVFQIVGSNPPETIKKLAEGKIEVTGYVEDVSKYFESCLCMASPLQLGAGIKVKVLEAMSAGVPVLTGNVGIEGIEAMDTREYIHCGSAKEYAQAIKMLLTNKNKQDEIGQAGRECIRRQFDVDAGLDALIERIDNIERKEVVF